MQFVSSFRRMVALTGAVAALAAGATATSAAVAPAQAEAAVYLRVICQDVHLRFTPGGPIIPSYIFRYGDLLQWASWPTTPGWIEVYFAGTTSWVDANCVTLA